MVWILLAGPHVLGYWPHLAVVVLSIAPTTSVTVDKIGMWIPSHMEPRAIEFHILTQLEPLSLNGLVGSAKLTEILSYMQLWITCMAILKAHFCLLRVNSPSS